MQAERIAGVRLQLGGHYRGSAVHWALVDAADFEWLSQWRWSYVRGYGYRPVVCDGRRTSLMLHRAILGLAWGDPRQADHINRDRLDNRRANLRIVTGPVNWQNTPSRGGTSRYRGVSWIKRDRKWAAQAQLHGRQMNLGSYKTEEEAAAVALAFRRQHMIGAVD